MKTRILAAIALVVALPAAAQANSVMEQRAFAQQHEALNTQAASEYQLLPSDYRINTVSGGHSTAADRARSPSPPARHSARRCPPGIATWRGLSRRCAVISASSGSRFLRGHP